MMAKLRENLWRIGKICQNWGKYLWALALKHGGHGRRFAEKREGRCRFTRRARKRPASRAHGGREGGGVGASGALRLPCAFAGGLRGRKCPGGHPLPRHPLRDTAASPGFAGDAPASPAFCSCGAARPKEALCLRKAPCSCLPVFPRPPPLPFVPAAPQGRWRPFAFEKRSNISITPLYLLGSRFLDF